MECSKDLVARVKMVFYGTVVIVKGPGISENGQESNHVTAQHKNTPKLSPAERIFPADC